MLGYGIRILTHGWDVRHLNAPAPRRLEIDPFEPCPPLMDQAETPDVHEGRIHATHPGDHHVGVANERLEPIGRSHGHPIVGGIEPLFQAAGRSGEGVAAQ